MLYDVAVYLRLSRDDGEKYESDSITNQRELVNKFIASNMDLKIYKEYSDDGYSGTNFNRPSFKEMEFDIESGKVNCVIVKDLSRFGRDYIEVGRYIDRYFPEKNVRFIAINDGIDSKKKEMDMIVPIKNIFNENYARDISKKVSSSLSSLQEQGKFIGSFASYGYMKNPLDKHKLIIDEYPASVVVRIYDMFISGMTKQKIANQLNEEGIMCPSAYKMSISKKYVNGRTKNNTYAWSYNTILEVLTKQVYIGNMQQRLQRNNGIRTKGKKTKKEDQIIVENTHEPIIDKATFEKAQNIINKNKNYTYNKNGVLSPLSGFIECSDCGKKMVKYYNYYKNDEKVFYFACASYRRYGKSVCTKHSIRYDTIESATIKYLNFCLNKIKNLKELAKNNKLNNTKKFNTQSEIEKTKTEIIKTSRLKKGLYEDYKEGIISKEEYVKYKDEYTLKEEMLEKKNKSLIALENTDDILESDLVSQLLKYEKIDKLDRDIVSLFIKKIVVNEDKSLDILDNMTKELSSMINNN